MRPSPLWAIVLLLAAPLTSVAAAWPWGEIPREELFATYFAECPNADAVVLLNHATLRVDEKFHLNAHHHVRTKILTDAGVDRGVVRIPYGAGEEIKQLRGHTIVPPGNEYKVDKAQIKDEGGVDGGVVTVSFPSAQKGAVLEWEYDVRSEKITRINPWPFQERDFVRVSRLELQTPPGLSYDAAFRWTPGVAPQPEVVTINDPDNQHQQISQSSWEFHNQAPLSPPPLVAYPEDYRIVLYLQLLGYNSDSKAELYRATLERQLSDARGFKDFGVAQPWAQIGKDLGARTAQWVADGAGVKEWAQSGGTAPSGTGEPLARALFARVRDGLATDADKRDAPKPGQAPAVPRVVVAAGHGTPNEKNLVLLRLLVDSGLSADPVYVRSRNTGPFEPRWRDASQLDRLIVRLTLDGRAVWLDAVPQCAFGMLAPESRAAKGLVAREDAGSMVDVAAGAPETSRNVTTQATLDERGTLAARSVITLAGDRALAARRSLLKAGDAAFVTQILHDRFGDAVTMDSVKVAGTSVPESALTIETTYHVTAYARAQGDRLQCRAPFLEQIVANPLPEGERRIPVELPFAGTSREDVTLHLPADIRVETCPPGGSARTPDVMLKTTHAASGDGITSSRELRVQDRLVSNEELNNLRTFFTTAKASDAAEYAVRRQLMKSAG